jgi:hypothetical protein
MDFINADSTHFKRLRDEIDQLNPRSCSGLIAYIKALAVSYRAGMFDDAAMRAAEAEITIDYMTQAENLLTGAGTGQFAYVPAAVLVGAILEDRLRRLCQRQNPPISILRSNNQKKVLSDYIDDLKRAGVYDEVKAKQLRDWANIRNAAAHGNFDQFNKQDVEAMIEGVKTFLADYL